MCALRIRNAGANRCHYAVYALAHIESIRPRLDFPTDKTIEYCPERG